MSEDPKSRQRLVDIFIEDGKLNFEVPRGTNMLTLLAALAEVQEHVRYTFTLARLQAEVKESQQQKIVHELIRQGRG